MNIFFVYDTFSDFLQSQTYTSPNIHLEQNIQNKDRTNHSFYIGIGDENDLQKIRHLREDHDFTQVQVGEKINVPQRTHAYYETGSRMIPPHVLCTLADLYDVSVDYLLERTNKK